MVVCERNVVLRVLGNEGVIVLHGQGVGIMDGYKDSRAAVFVVGWEAFVASERAALL